MTQWTKRRVLALAAGYISWLFCLLVWITSFPLDRLRMQLMAVVPLFLSLGLFLFLVALLMSVQELLHFFSKIGKKHWQAVSLIMVLAFILVHWVAPRTHRLFYDEDIYEAIGLDIAYNNQAAMVQDGRWEYGQFHSLRTEYNKQPNAWPFLISLVYRVFGVGENAIFNLSNALFVLSCGLVFICGTILFGNPLDGVFAALIYAIIPENALWFSTMGVEPATACFSLLAMTATVLFFRKRSPRFLFLALCAWSFAVQFRPETILLIGVVFFIFYIDGWDEVKSPGFYGFWLLFLVLISAHLAHLYAVRDESWGSSGTKLSWVFFTHNVFTNTLYYWNNKRFPASISVLAMIGAFWPREGKVRLYVGLWFLTAWGIFLFFYAGSYDYGADVRFSILSMAPLALLAGHGAVKVVDFLDRHLNKTQAIGIVVVSLGITLLFFLPSIRAKTEEAWECRDDHAVAEKFAAQIPEDGIIMTHNPNMFQIWGKNAAQMSVFMQDPNYVRQALRPQFGNKIYLHWNYWCNVNIPTQRSFVDYILRQYETTLMDEKIIRGKRYALYQIGNEKMITPSVPNKSVQ